jgi:hypothetical protein
MNHGVKGKAETDLRKRDEQAVGPNAVISELSVMGLTFIKK